MSTNPVDAACVQEETAAAGGTTTEAGVTRHRSDSEFSHDSNVETVESAAPDPSAVSLRSYLRPRDMPQLRMLHDQCFPIQYEETFFQWLQTDAAVCVVAVVRSLLHEQNEAKVHKTHQPAAEKVTNTEAFSEAAACETTQPGDEERVVGFVVGKVVALEGLIHGNAIGYISTFGVHPCYRRNGIGRQLLDAFAERLRLYDHFADDEDASFHDCLAISSVCLHCLTSNTTALKFYQQQGFAQVERMHNYYSFGGANHDGFLLQRVLEDGGAVQEKRAEGVTIIESGPCQRGPICSDEIENGAEDPDAAAHIRHIETLLSTQPKSVRIRKRHTTAWEMMLVVSKWGSVAVALFCACLFAFHAFL